MKRIVLLIMIGLTGWSLIYAAENKDEQVESVREIRKKINQLRALLMRMRPGTLETANIEADIQRLGAGLEAQEAQSGSWGSVDDEYDIADDKHVTLPERSEPLSEADQKMIASMQLSDDGSDVRAPIPDVEERLIGGGEAEFPGLQQAMASSLAPENPTSAGPKKIEEKNEDEDDKTTNSKPKKSEVQRERAQRMVDVLSSFNDSDGKPFPGAVAGLAGEYDNNRDLWLDPKAEPKFKELRDAGEVKSIAISGDGKWIATGSPLKKEVDIWDSQTEKLVSRLHRESSGFGSSVVISNDGNRVIVGDRSRVSIWDRESGTLIDELPAFGIIETILISGNDRWVVAVNAEGRVQIWDSSRKVERKLRNSTSRKVVAISGDGTWMVTTASGAWEAEIAYVWDMESGELERKLQGHIGRVRAVAISRDGRWVVTGSFDQSAIIWDRQSGKQEHVLRGHAGSVTQVAISDDNQWVITGSGGPGAHDVRIWNRQSGELEHVLRHPKMVLSVAISNDGRSVITVSTDGIVRIWDRQSGALLHKLESPHGVARVAISEDDGLIVTVSENNKMIRIWSAEPGREPSLEEQLIDIVNMRATVIKSSPEIEEDLQRALTRVEILIARGANPEAEVPTDGGGKEPLWQMAERVLPKGHRIAEYLKNVAAAQREGHKAGRQDEGAALQERVLAKHSAIAYINTLLAQVDDRKYAALIEWLRDEINGLDITRISSLAAIEGIKKRADDEFQVWQEAVDREGMLD